MTTCLIDFTGKRFGLYFVESEASPIRECGKPVRMWACLCDCGKRMVVRHGALTDKRIGGCGCTRAEMSKNINTKHGMYRSAIYKTWSSMVQRCTNSKIPSYKDYGGRGIAACNDWLIFENFYRDVGDKPSPKHSMDRIDNEGNYCIENIRWATSTQQALNTRIRKDNKTGLTGVRVRNKSWTAEICLYGINKRIGTYSTLFDAACARISRENKLFGGLR